jgi:hypothetical protein
MLKTTQDNVVTIKFDDISAGWEQWIMLSSDQHTDSPFCNKQLQTTHLDEALRKEALIFFGGDLFDAMQGKRDPRASYRELEPLLKQDNYFDALVNSHADYYAKYAKNIMMVGKGNHEMSVLRHHSTDLLQRLAFKLNQEQNSDISVGGYGGWVRFQFTWNKTKRQMLQMKYYHGSGGDAPVTKGVLQTARQAVYLPDATIVWNGHNHNEYIVPLARERISLTGKIYQDLQWHVRTPGYKNGYGNGSEGFEVESGMPPKPMGCVWLKLYLENDRIKATAISDIR